MGERQNPSERLRSRLQHLVSLPDNSGSRAPHSSQNLLDLRMRPRSLGLSESSQGYVFVHMHDNTSDRGCDILSSLALGGNLRHLAPEGRRRPTYDERYGTK